MLSGFYLMVMIAGWSSLLLVVAGDRIPPPVMGVLVYLEDGRFTSIRQYLPVSYVKYLEGAGVRVIPLFCCQPPHLNNYKDFMLEAIDGILLPDFLLSEPLNDWREGGAYHDTLNLILTYAQQINTNFKYFPVWAIGSSFIGMVSLYERGDINWLRKCLFIDVSERLQISDFVKQDPSKTQMFSYMNQTMPNILQILENEDITYFHTEYCIESSMWPKLLASREFKVISTVRQDVYDHISTIEHQEYPFYGSLWLPQVHQFEFNYKYNAHVNHGRQAIQVAQYFANFLVNEARKNLNLAGPWNDNVRKKAINWYDKRQRHFAGKDPNNYCQEIYQFPEECFYPFFYHFCYKES